MATTLGCPDITEEIRRRIAAHDLPPGSRLRETMLAEQYGVSRARIREVLSALEERGLVERIPNRGAVVIRMEAEQVLELYDVREVLESMAVRIATQKQPQDSWKDLAALFGDDLWAAIKRHDFEPYVLAVSTFQRRIMDAAEHRLIRSILDSLYDRTRMLTRRLAILPGRAEQGFKDYQEMVQAMQRGDAMEAERLERKNIRESREWFLRFVQFIL